MASIFMKLGLQQTPEDNRRVLAVLAYLRGRVTSFGKDSAAWLSGR